MGLLARSFQKISHKNCNKIITEQSIVMSINNPRDVQARIAMSKKKENCQKKAWHTQLIAHTLLKLNSLAKCSLSDVRSGWGRERRREWKGKHHHASRTAKSVVKRMMGDSWEKILESAKRCENLRENKMLLECREKFSWF